MATFKEANQIRTNLKMKLSNYSWYNSSSIGTDSNDYCIILSVKKINNEVKKIVPPVLEGVSIKMELEKSH